MERSIFPKRYKNISARKKYRVKKQILLRPRYLIVISLLISIMGGGFYFFLISDKFSVKEANIYGLRSISKDQVIGETNNVLNQKKFIFLKSRNYFAFSKDKMRAAILQAFPKIGEVDVDVKKDSGVLDITVKERDAIGVWCAEVKCFYFDKLGVIFEEAPKSTGSLILAVEDKRNFEPSLGIAVLTNDEIIFLNDIRGLISRNFPFSAQLFIITQKSEFELVTSENWRVLLSKKESPEYQLSNLKYLLDEKVKKRRSELDYVDLRLGNRIYYKYLGEGN